MKQDRILSLSTVYVYITYIRTSTELPLNYCSILVPSSTTKVNKISLPKASFYFCVIKVHSQGLPYPYVLFKRNHNNNLY